MKNADRPLTPQIVWTWKIRGKSGRWILCRFAAATREDLVQCGKPSPEAKPIKVRMTPVEVGDDE